jgi:hypothetical protein
MDNESIMELLDEYDKYSKALKKHIYDLCWHMRGGIKLEEMFMLGPLERELIEKIVDDHIKTTNETRIPFF